MRKFNIITAAMAAIVLTTAGVRAQNLFVPERLTLCNAPIVLDDSECYFELDGFPITGGFDPSDLVFGIHTLYYDCGGDSGTDYFEMGSELWLNIRPLQATGCPGQLVVLEAEHLELVDGASYLWQPGNHTGPVLSFYPTQSATYTLTVTASEPGGAVCTGNATYYVNADGLNIDVTATPNPSCPNELVFLSAETSVEGVGYTWRSPMGVIGTDATLFVNPFTTTTYTVTANDSAGCTGQRTITVNVTQIPTLSASTQNATCPTCTNGSMTIQPPGLQYYVNGLLYFNNTISGLAPGTYQVSAVVPPNFCSTQSIFVTVGVTESCPVPTGLQLVSATSNSALLSWNAVSGASSYRLRYRRASATLWTAVVTAATSINIPGLVSETNYVAAVAAICASGTSLYSPLLAFSTTSESAPVCTASPGFNAVAGSSSGTVFVSWTEVTAATRYQIQYRRVGSSFWTSMSVNAPAANALLTGLTPGQSYQVRMRVICGATAMTWQPAVTVTAPGGKWADPNAENGFWLYPNPAKNWVHLRIDSPQSATIDDLSGKTVLRFNAAAGDNVLDVSTLPAGVYILRAGTAAKLVVE